MVVITLGRTLWGRSPWVVLQSWISITEVQPGRRGPKSGRDPDAVEVSGSEVRTGSRAGVSGLRPDRGRRDPKSRWGYGLVMDSGVPGLVGGPWIRGPILDVLVRGPILDFSFGGPFGDTVVRSPIVGT